MFLVFRITVALILIICYYERVINPALLQLKSDGGRKDIVHSTRFSDVPSLKRKVVICWIKKSLIKKLKSDMVQRIVSHEYVYPVRYPVSFQRVQFSNSQDRGDQGPHLGHPMETCHTFTFGTNGLSLKYLISTYIATININFKTPQSNPSLPANNQTIIYVISIRYHKKWFQNMGGLAYLTKYFWCFTLNLRFRGSTVSYGVRQLQCRNLILGIRAAWSDVLRSF